jgi:wyosine [tRNA(Phe)-imidazoG37] synthetase (radical SAM superfamily)
MSLSQEVAMIAFGPVPSRRLGRSLGINNIPPKICSYSCVYCQLGRTLKRQVQRTAFYPPETLIAQVRDKVHQVEELGEKIDALTFVPDGEPTLDQALETEIVELKALERRIAVITNASLLWRDDVQAALSKADWVSLKVDAVDERLWRTMDRPHASLRMERIREGMRSFAEAFRGVLVTETMLVRDLNDSEPAVRAVAALLEELNPAVAYLSVPTRPPAEQSVCTPREDALNRAFQRVTERVSKAELLIGYEGDEFSSTGDLQQDLLSITSVHPMRKEAVESFVDRAPNGSWSDVEQLIKDDRLVMSFHEGHIYYVRRLDDVSARSKEP